MNSNGIQPNSAWKFLWLIPLCGLPALGWLGLLDNYSSEQLNNSISSAGLIYGTARGINALVSMLQGTELDIVFLTFSIGEVLDPINDLIERFSAIILIALGSLAVQKILLALVSHTMFNTLLTILAAATGLSLLAGNQRLLAILLRSFLVIAFFRFSLGLVVTANAWVDANFLDKADRQRHIAMESFQNELREVDMLSKKQDDLEADIISLTVRLDQLAVQRSEYMESVKIIDSKIVASRKRLKDLLRNADRLCALSSLSPTCPDIVKAENRKLDQLISAKDTIQGRIDVVAEETVENQEALACLSKRQNGEHCGLLDRLPDVPNTAELRAKMDGINASLGDFAENAINLLMSLLLKTVVIPLLFFFILLKIVRINWERLR